MVVEQSAEHALPAQYLCGILGNPLGHSISPVLHTWGFAQANRPGAYFTWEKKPDEVADFIHAMRTLPITGASVTIPYKQTVLPFLDAVSDRARTAGAVNTLYWHNGKLMGENTDVSGFLAPLAGKKIASALVLGAGGAARAVLTALAIYGVTHVVVAARDIEKSAALETAFGCRLIAWEKRVEALHSMEPGLVINATPLGMRGAHEAASPLPLGAWQQAHGVQQSGFAASSSWLAYDLVYNPLRTHFLAAAAAHGIPIQDGLAFFVAQGIEQFRLWTGVTLPTAEARAVVQNALQQHEQKRHA